MSTLLVADASRTGRVPPLCNGDWLKRDEFHRRYLAMPGLKKAELVQNTVFMPSPVRFSNHGSPHAQVITWLGYYAAHRSGVEIGDNSTVILDDDNEPQPDVLLRRTTEQGGQSWVGPDGYIHGPPEFIAEIAATSIAYDLHQKKDVYRRHGVREYMVWSVDEGRIDWWELRDGVYETIPLDADGLARSRVFPGLWLDAHALIRGDLPALLAGVQLGLDA
jgi:Putative restriction endonuclease